MDRCRTCNVILNKDNWVKSRVERKDRLCKECSYEYRKQWQKNNRDKCRKYSRNFRKVHQESYRKVAREKERERRKKVRMDVLTHYSNGTPKCNHCNISDLRVLTIDHINSDGAKMRKELNLRSSTEHYDYIIKQKYPSGYQVLCMNCQFIKRHTNHEVKRMYE